MTRKTIHLGLLWDDPDTHDDIVVTNEMYFMVNKPVKLIINSRDVIHDVGMVHFRHENGCRTRDAHHHVVYPKYTTQEMKKKLGNPGF